MDMPELHTAIHSHIESCKLRNETQDKTNADYNARLRVLEKFMWLSIGGSLLGGGIGSFLAQALFKG